MNDGDANLMTTTFPREMFYQDCLSHVDRHETVKSSIAIMNILTFLVRYFFIYIRYMSVEIVLLNSKHYCQK